MPTYEYACDACGHKFEEFQSIPAKPVKKCPACKKNKVKRLISAGGGFIFKGSGFYLTDYRSDSYKAGEKRAAGGNSPAGTPASSAGAGKTESTTKSESTTKAETK